MTPPSLTHHQFTCPHCDERTSMLLELSAGTQHYVEDCEVCENDAGELTRKAVTLLAEANELHGTLHVLGVRDEYRSWLTRATFLLVMTAAETVSSVEVC